MDLGDLIDFRGEAWIVARTTESGEVCIVTYSGKTDLVPGNLDDTDPNCRVLGNPYQTWPYVSLPLKSLGKVTGVALPKIDGDLVWLRPFYDWLVGEPLRIGGALYLSRTLGITYPDRVVVRFERGQTSVRIPRKFTPVGQRRTDAQFSRVKVEPKQLTAYDYLLGDTLGEDEK